ncbi:MULTISPECIES: hypothetical protein [Pseudomonas]|uniref:Lipoprotein n=1 Tax=Pseudomonas azadiae TaxID=2843612 RepID=A0ABS6P2W6_9PSED|nr:MULTISPECIES: hypothetical protein [Pseudomonas]MBV4454810.1 hypothetical protein [Pseudomonas azadiae]NMF39057.1 hypothetical protein [Pseudomonas sp. SWRI 103]
MSKRWFGVLIVLGVAGLAGCAGKPDDSFTLEVDLPAEFRFIGAAYYGPATRQTCTLPRRRGKRPERKIFIARYKPVAERVSFELPLTEVIEGCPTVLRSVEFDIYAKWGKRDTDVGGDLTGFPILDDSGADESGMPVTGIQELHRQCQWLFRTVGPQHAIVKILRCRFLNTASPLSGFVQRDQLPGKTLRMVLDVIGKEEPAVGDNWVVVPGGWRRCRGRSFEDLDAFCNGNTSDFKPIKMPDGRVCDVYPSCK